MIDVIRRSHFIFKILLDLPQAKIRKNESSAQSRYLQTPHFDPFSYQHYRLFQLQGAFQRDSDSTSSAAG